MGMFKELFEKSGRSFKKSNIDSISDTLKELERCRALLSEINFSSVDDTCVSEMTTENREQLQRIENLTIDQIKELKKHLERRNDPSLNALIDACDLFIPPISESIKSDMTTFRKIQKIYGNNTEIIDHDILAIYSESKKLEDEALKIKSQIKKVINTIGESSLIATRFDTKHKKSADIINEVVRNIDQAHADLETITSLLTQSIKEHQKQVSASVFKRLISGKPKSVEQIFEEKLRKKKIPGNNPILQHIKKSLQHEKLDDLTAPYIVQEIKSAISDDLDALKIDDLTNLITQHALIQYKHLSLLSMLSNKNILAQKEIARLNPQLKYYSELNTLLKSQDQRVKLNEDYSDFIHALAVYSDTRIDISTLRDMRDCFIKIQGIDEEISQLKILYNDNKDKITELYKSKRDLLAKINVAIPQQLTLSDKNMQKQYSNFVEQAKIAIDTQLKEINIDEYESRALEIKLKNSRLTRRAKELDDDLSVFAPKVKTSALDTSKISTKNVPVQEMVSEIHEQSDKLMKTIENLTDETSTNIAREYRNLQDQLEAKPLQISDLQDRIDKTLELVHLQKQTEYTGLEGAIAVAKRNIAINQEKILNLDKSSPNYAKKLGEFKEQIHVYTNQIKEFQEELHRLTHPQKIELDTLRINDVELQGFIAKLPQLETQIKDYETREIASASRFAHEIADFTKAESLFDSFIKEHTLKQSLLQDNIDTLASIKNKLDTIAHQLSSQLDNTSDPEKLYTLSVQLDTVKKISSEITPVINTLIQKARQSQLDATRHQIKSYAMLIDKFKILDKNITNLSKGIENTSSELSKLKAIPSNYAKIKNFSVQLVKLHKDKLLQQNVKLKMLISISQDLKDTLERLPQGKSAEKEAINKLLSKITADIDKTRQQITTESAKIISLISKVQKQIATSKDAVNAANLLRSLESLVSDISDTFSKTNVPQKIDTHKPTNIIQHDRKLLDQHLDKTQGRT